MSEARREAAIDAIKAAGIVTIVLIHALRAPWDPGISPLERWLGQLTRFGVPGFLLASGWLYAGARADVATTLRRLRRILLPYLVASLLAQLWRVWHGQPSEGGGVLQDLLFASSFGPYYYVLVIAGLVALTPFLASLPNSLVYALTGFFVANQWWVDAAGRDPLDFYWHVRSPLMWWGYFLVGWAARLNAPALAALTAPRRGALCAAAGAAVAVLMLATAAESALGWLGARTAGWLGVYAILALIAIAASYWESPPAWLRSLSDATYTIYLYHLFFVLALQAWLPAPPLRADALAIGVPWLGGLAGGLAVALLGRRLLGARARDWLGA
jgi:surface polysaccharide O-acyltransferase-like enzyme